MSWKSLAILIAFVVITISGNFALADCPSADLTGDCFVDYEDFALMASQWLTGGPNIPDDMVCIPGGQFEMGDHFSPEGHDDELPLHDVLLDAFFMSKFEITNLEYCDYLNSAYDACDIKVDGGHVFSYSDTSNSYPYCDTHSYSDHSQIDYDNVSGTFSVRTKGKHRRDMSNDPMVLVSWYGSAAYCNWRSDQEGYQTCYNLSTSDCDFSKKGYRLPTEAEWEYAARGGLSGKRFPWADPNITHSQANYHSLATHAYPYDVSSTRGYHPAYYDWPYLPYTAPVGSFSANGYGLYDMSGNVWEWCNDWWNSTYYSTSPYDNPQGPVSGAYRVIRGGGAHRYAYECRVAHRPYSNPLRRSNGIGFRIVLDLE